MTTGNGHVGRRAALYLRVSDKDLELDNQRRELAEWAEAQGYSLVATYSDTLSGARADRTGLKAALTAAHRRSFDVLLIWALDRLSREGIEKMLGYVRDLTRCGVRLRSLREPWLDNEGPIGELLVAIFAWVARQERDRIRERILTGLARAKAKGTKSGRRIGRPTRYVDVAALRSLVAGEGLSLRAAARRLGVPAQTAHRAYLASQNHALKTPNGGPAAART